MKRRECLLWSCAALSPWAQGAQSSVSANALSVLHWWTSEGERRAANALAEVLARHGFQWRDVAVPGGAGVAAIKVLNSRILMGNPPDMAQLIGSNLTDWANAGLVASLASNKQQADWTQALFESVREQVMYQGAPIAAPLGIHRINNLYIHREIFQRFGLSPPTSWNDLLTTAQTLKSHGIEPLAWSDQPWQVATVFEAMLAGDVGAQAYRDLVVRRQPQAWLQRQVQTTLQRMVELREQTALRPRERRWSDSARALFNGQAAMMIMGDWVSGEMRAWNPAWEDEFICKPVPQTERLHLFSLDSLALLKRAPQAPRRTPQGIAELLISPEAQYAYNDAKGSVPVRQDTDVDRLSYCARASWTAFANADVHRLPSLAHRMAAPESIKDAVAHLVWQFTTRIQPDIGLTQRRLAAAVRAPDATH